MKKTFRLVFVLSMIIAVGILTAFTVSATEPTPVATAEELASIEVSGNYILVADIDLTDKAFTPIGDETAPFIGTLDGNGHKIKGLTFTEHATRVGLLGVAKNATIKNITLTDVSISINSNNTSDIKVAALCANTVGKVIFENCTVSGTINVKAAGEKVYVGGITAYSSEEQSQYPTYKLCRNNINITADSSSYTGTSTYVAGIVAFGMYADMTLCENNGDIVAKAKIGAEAGGLSANYRGDWIGDDSEGINDMAANIFESVNNGNITAEGLDATAGGIAATSQYGPIYDTYNTGAVSAIGSRESIAGGIIATSQWENVYIRCYNIGVVTVPTEGKAGAFAGTVNPMDTFENNFVLDTLTTDVVNGKNSVTGVTKLSSEEMKDSEKFTGFDFTNTWYIPTSGEYEYPMLIGLVTKTTELSGDADGDGAISSTDVIVLARYVASWNGYADLINLANADVYADGVVDTQDVIVLARHIANWNGYKTLPVQPNA